MAIHPDLRPNDIIIIGFTGPIGSGCTELSRFISDTKEFEAFMKKLKYLPANDKSKLSSHIFDTEVKKLFRKKNLKEKRILELKELIAVGEDTHINIQELSEAEKKLKYVFKDIKEILEKRNYIYSLQKYFDDGYYKKRLRISCSSIIVFELIRQLPSLENNISDKDDLNAFIQLINTLISKYSVSIDKFNEAFSKIRGLHKHDRSVHDIDEDIVPYCFDAIKKVKSKLKENPLYRKLMQDFGDNLRASGNPYKYVDKEWITNNKYEFQSNNCFVGRYIDYLVHYYSIAKDCKMFLIDSLRNPMSIKYLRKRYSAFYLVSLYAGIDQRMERIKKNMGDSYDESDFIKQDERDQGRNFADFFDVFFKQNVRDAVLLSDIAINNEEAFANNLMGNLKRYESSLFVKLLRYLALIVEPGCTKPTDEEMFMNMAYTMSMKSNCVSRKVGAVIEGEQGYLIGAGWNDVGEGQISCGLRDIKDLRMKEYSRCLSSIKKVRGDMISDGSILEDLSARYGSYNCCFCLKDELSRAEVNRSIEKLSKKLYTNNDLKEMADRLKNKLKIKRLEYCKALHAEENAILQSAKIGGVGLKDSKLYSTTYPCELCAKKIQQAGIKEVVYVEPYPRALSEDLFLHDGIKKVNVRQFEGVKGYAYMGLFRQKSDRKDRQQFIKNGFTRDL